MEGLRLAAELEGALLSGPGGSLILVERILQHAAPRIAVLGQRKEDLQAALQAYAQLAEEAIPLNLIGILPLPGSDFAAVLERERRRIGALVAALDASLPWLMDKPMLVRCLPGRIRGSGALEPLALTSIQAFELRRHLGSESSFLQPAWDGARAVWWPGTSRPPHSEVEIAPLELPTSSLLSDVLRQSLRAATAGPIDFLPMVADPSGLHALRQLTPEATAFRGPEAAWREALRRFATLPAPPHFCARC
jgi:hypothetical protein